MRWLRAFVTQSLRSDDSRAMGIRTSSNQCAAYVCLLLMSDGVHEARRISSAFYHSCIQRVPGNGRLALAAEQLYAEYLIPNSDEASRASGIGRLKDVLDKRRRFLGPEDPDTLASMTHLTTFLEDDEAREFARAVYEATLKQHGPTAAETASTAALFASELGHTAEAAKLQRYVLDVRAQLLGPRHEYTTIAASNYRTVLRGCQEITD